MPTRKKKTKLPTTEFESEGCQPTTSAHVSGTEPNDSEISALLLSLVGDLAQVVLLCKELDAAGFAANKNRIDALLALVREIPTEPPQIRQLGFQNSSEETH